MRLKMAPRGYRNHASFCCECGFRIGGLKSAEIEPVSRLKVSRRNPISMRGRCADCHENWGELPDWQ